ncbi:S-layer homology domain-containing protein [Candidatus Gracilibacteria bacterium]|nr:S-layer homology domain-containing protein [Candidatus Gracilibacteria bacterium]
MKKILSIIFISTFLFSQNIFAETPTFSDVPVNYKNFQAINNLYRRGIIGGYADGTFRPEKNLNRVEALKILLLSAKIQISDDIGNVFAFKDTSKDAWYFKYIANAQSLGIVNGYPDGTFKPGNPVNLAEALKMLLEANSEKYDKNVSEAPYYDVPANSWFAGYFDYAKKNKLLDWPKNGKINPGKNVNRAEFSEIIYRFLENKKEIEQNAKLAIPYFKSEEGKETKSGEIYQPGQLTAGISGYNFGTNLLVTNVANGESVIVKVNDDGPEMQDKKIKLSKTAFNAIANGKNKILKVKIEKIDYQEKIPDEIFQETNSCKFPKNRGKIEKNFFKNIKLFNEIEKNFKENEIYNISGKVLNGEKNVSIFIKNEDGSKTQFLGDVGSDGFFSVDIDLGKKGQKQIGIIAGTSGSSYIADIEVYEINCDKNFAQKFDTKPTNLNFKIKNNKTYIKWTGTGNLVRIVFMQGKNKIVKFINKEDNYLELKPKWFKDFSEGEMMWQVALASSLSGNSFDQDTGWNISETQKTQITKHFYEEYKTNQIEIFNLEPTYIFGGNIKISGRLKSEIKTKAKIILPDGNVKEINIQADKQKIKNSNGVEIYPVLSKFSFNFKPKEKGTYIIEINHVSGIAVFNYPIYEEGKMPILPDFRDLQTFSGEELKIDEKKFQAEMLSMINKARAELGLNRLILIPELTILAQDRADDMAKNNYLSHWNKEGKTANDLKFSYGIKMGVGENLAKSQNLENAHLGLMRSAGHRANILNEEWSRAGFGFAKGQNGKLITVQIFSSSPILETNLDQERLDIIDEINKKRDKYLVPNTILHAIAQNWVEKMVNENFFNFVNDKGESLNDSIKSAGLKTTIGTMIIANSSYKGLLEEIQKSERIFDNVWKKIGIGIKQGDDGIIKFVMIYTY